MKKRYKVLIILLVIIFFLLLGFVKTNKIIAFDTYIYNLIISLKSDDFTKILTMITNLGDTLCIIAIIIICLVFFKDKIYPKLIIFNILGIVFLNQLLKHLIMRPRPTFPHLVEETGFSFPSGHSMAAFGFYGLFIYMIYKSNLKTKTKIFLIIPLSILIILIGLSRIYLGVHYFSDVLAGFITSLIYLILFIHFTKKYLK